MRKKIAFSVHTQYRMNVSTTDCAAATGLAGSYIKESAVTVVSYSCCIMRLHQVYSRFY